ncbi:metallophosphoesterase family protein [Paenibacillus sp. 7124]|uniref:Phosphoesterase n=1 Tax=Paenibacillus apii TaxID=1850370 RepID=A0A6M1PJ57_9BACL|nr:metallophosphoesterase family protein [Paenibacillus apii]NGM82584.1 metallophosphoesterase family protein [Paenibacillus apii]
MKVGIVSDTHLGRMVKLPKALTEGLAGVELILHLGDWVDLAVYDELSALAPVDGIAGNNDGTEIVRRFGERKILTLAGAQIGMVHGHRPYTGKGTDSNALRAFAGESLDCILFGHSHQPLMRSENGVLLFNPGSPTDKRREKLYSFGLMNIEGGKIEARHIFYDSKG